MKNIPLLTLGILLSSVCFAEEHSEDWEPTPVKADPMTFTADTLAVDNVTKALVASGHVHAVSAPFKLMSEFMERDEDGVMHFYDPTCATTCTNREGHTHWNITGDVVYRSKRSVVMRNAWVSLFEFPLIYIPYLWYPLDTDCGFKWMPGYTGRWGGFILTRYRYHLLGDPEHFDHTYWLKGNTNFDYRYINGAALGEDLFWNLGDFGNGKFQVYYAWDQDAENRYGVSNGNGNWGSPVEMERYGLSFQHDWRMSERDRVFLRAYYLSDSYFQEDFTRFDHGFFAIRQSFAAHQNSGAFWEHLEDRVVVGGEVSGRLNEFYGMTQRLPEFYVDINPGTFFSLPLTYESQNRIGMMDRKYAKYANAEASVFGTNPGLWADYNSFRFDTYHRLSQSYRTFDDTIAVSPRVGFHGTYWKDSGSTDLKGQSEAKCGGDLLRSIAEAGVTIAGRANGWVNDEVSHMVEPYADILAQKAWHSHDGKDTRPLIFDNIDQSMIWEDQFAGRGRNLPYTYVGVTPGIRNSWSELTESGQLYQFFEIDAYAATMFGKTDFYALEDYGDIESHKLAKLGDPNYGKRQVNVMPGVRVKWSPDPRISLRARAEYDSENGQMAMGDAGFSQKVSKDFEYAISYSYRNHRYWDYSSIPYGGYSGPDELNLIKNHFFFVSATWQPLTWFAMSPLVRWDVREQELDTIGSWFDFMTDCIGFRLILEYTNEYTRIDGYHRDSDWSIGFFIFLRAYGAHSGDIFSGQ